MSVLARLRLACRNVADHYLPPSAKKILILFEEPHYRVSRFLCAELERKGKKVHLIRTDVTKTWRDCASEIEKEVKSSDLVVNFYFLKYGQNEWLSERTVFLRDLVKGAAPLVPKSKYRLFRDFDEKRFIEIFTVDPLRIDRINRALISLSRNCALWKVTGLDGTDLMITTDPKRWPLLNDNGFRLEDYEMPPGEVLTSPVSVDGRMVLSGAIIGTIPVGRKYGLLPRKSLDIVFSNGKVVEVKSSNARLEEDVQFCIFRDDHTKHVGEVAIGTGIGIKKITGLNYNFEEKLPGFHLGVGIGLADEEIGGQRLTQHHIDFVLPRSTVYFENYCVMKEGRFVDEVLSLQSS